MNNGGPHKEEPGGTEQDQRLPLDEVERLVEMVRDSGIGEIQVRQGELEVTVRAQEPMMLEGDPPVQPVQTTTPDTAFTEPEGSENETDERNGLYEIRSPLVGTFYRAPAPGEDDYVQVGDQVREGQTLCIVEAMKLMNEIPADVAGEVVEVLADNAGGVQYDQPLFYLQPES